MMLFWFRSHGKTDVDTGPLADAMVQSTKSQEQKLPIERPFLLKIACISSKQVRSNRILLVSPVLTSSNRRIKLILSRHHCPKDPMRLPSACATSVPFRARYQFSHGFFSPGRKRLYLEVSWRFFRFKSFKIVTKKYQKTCLCQENPTRRNYPVQQPSEQTIADRPRSTWRRSCKVFRRLGTTRQELGATDRSHSESEGGHSSLLWRRRYWGYPCVGWR